MARPVVRAPGIIGEKRQVQGKQDAYDTEKIRRDPTIGSDVLGVLRSLSQPQQENNRRDRANNGDECQIVLVVLAYMCRHIVFPSFNLSCRKPGSSRVP